MTNLIMFHQFSEENVYSAHTHNSNQIFGRNEKGRNTMSVNKSILFTFHIIGVVLARILLILTQHRFFLRSLIEQKTE